MLDVYEKYTCMQWFLSLSSLKAIPSLPKVMDVFHTCVVIEIVFELSL